MKKHLIALLLLSSSAPLLAATPSQLTGILKDINGLNFNGTLYISVPATITPIGGCTGAASIQPQVSLSIIINNGMPYANGNYAAWPSLYGTSCMTIAQKYIATLRTTNGQLQYTTTQWTVTDPSVDVNTLYKLTPVPVTGVAIIAPSSSVDLSKQLLDAYSSLGGIAGTPTVSAEVDLISNKTYYYSTSLELPHDSSSPYISNPILDCKNATLVYAGTNTDPAILIRGQNANNSAYAPELRNCNIIRADTSGPILLNKDRMGFRLTNVQLQGGNDSYAVQITTSDGGPGYLEQSLLQNVAMVLPSTNGIHVTCDGTGTCGYQYNRGYNLRYEFGAGTHSQIYIDGSTILASNNDYTTSTNTNGAGTMYIARVAPGGLLISSRITHNGEPTSGGALFKFGGGGTFSAECTNLSRTNVVYENGATCIGSNIRIDTLGPLAAVNGYVMRAGEGDLKSNSASIDDGHRSVRLQAKPNGGDTTDYDQWLMCPTTDAQPNVWTSTTCLNSLYHNYTGNWWFGVGGYDSSPNATVAIPYTITVNGKYGSVVPGTVNNEYTNWQLVGGIWTLVHYMTTPPMGGTQGQPGSPEIWQYYYGGPGDGYAEAARQQAMGTGFTNRTQNGNEDAKSFSVNGTAGWSGTCTPPKSTIVTNGLITGCN